MNIGNSCFENCSSLVDCKLPSDTYKIKSSAFKGCSKLKYISIPEGITELPNYMAQNCVNLEKVTLPSTLVKSGTSCFENCVKLKEVNIPNSFTDIGNRCFYGCGLSGTFSFPAGPTVLKQNILSQTKIENVIIPEGVETIVNTTSFMDYLVSINIPSTVTKLTSFLATTPNLRAENIDNKTRRFKFTNDGLVLDNVANSVISGFGSYTHSIVPSGYTDLGVENSDTGSGLLLTYQLRDLTLSYTMERLHAMCLYHCENLEHISCYATTAPTLVGNKQFEGIKKSGILSVPIDSQGYDVWLTRINSQEGYNWTLEYISD